MAVNGHFPMVIPSLDGFSFPAIRGDIVEECTPTLVDVFAHCDTLTSLFRLLAYVAVNYVGTDGDVCCIYIPGSFGLSH